MKRFASHFIFLPGYGYLKQYVVGVEEGRVVSVFPLTEEIEGVEWFPGVSVLLNNEEDISEGYSGIFQKSSEVLEELPEFFCQETFPSEISAYLFYPFDFTTMQPVGGTRHRPLR
ncbi:hypothetical protein [Bacteroides sp.]